MRKLNLFLIIGVFTFAHAFAADEKEAAVKDETIQVADAELSKIGAEAKDLQDKVKALEEKSEASRDTGMSLKGSQRQQQTISEQCLTTGAQGQCPIQMKVAGEEVIRRKNEDVKVKKELAEKAQDALSTAEKKVTNTLEDISKEETKLAEKQSELAATEMMNQSKRMELQQEISQIEANRSKLQQKMEAYHKVFEALHKEVHNQDGAKPVAERQASERANGLKPKDGWETVGGGGTGNGSVGSFTPGTSNTGSSTGLAATPQQLAAAGNMGAAGATAAGKNSAGAGSKSASAMNSNPTAGSAINSVGSSGASSSSFNKSGYYSFDKASSDKATNVANAVRSPASGAGSKSTAVGEVGSLHKYADAYKIASLTDGKIKDSPYNSAGASTGKVGTGSGGKGGDAKDAKKEESLKTFAGDEKLGSGSSELALAGSETDAAIQSIMNDLNIPSISEMTEDEIARLSQEIPGFDALLSAHGGKLPPSLSGANFTMANLRRAIDAQQAALGGVSGDESLSLFLRVKTYHNQCQKKGCVSRSRLGNAHSI